MRRGPAPPHTVSPSDDRFARLDRRARSEAPRRADISRSVARAARAVVHLRRAAAEARGRRGAVGRRQARGLRAVLRSAPPPPADAHRRDTCRARRRASQTLLDLGCGTGASGAAWAGGVREAAARGRDRSASVGDRRGGGDLSRVRDSGNRASGRHRDRRRCRKGRSSILAAFTMNELAEPERDALLARLVERASQGDRVLIVEPLAGFVARWWNRWRDDVRGRRRPRRRVAAAHRAAADRREARSRGRPESPRDHRTIAVVVTRRRLTPPPA